MRIYASFLIMDPEPQPPGEEMWKISRPEKSAWLTENLWRQAVEKTCRLPQLEALSHPAGGGGGGTAPAPRTVPTAARHRTVPPRVHRRLMARGAAGLGGTGRTHRRGPTRRSRRTDGRGTTRRARRHLSRGYCGRRGVSAKQDTKSIYYLFFKFGILYRAVLLYLWWSIWCCTVQEQVPNKSVMNKRSSNDP